MTNTPAGDLRSSPATPAIQAQPDGARLAPPPRARLSLPSAVPPTRLRWDLIIALVLVHSLALMVFVPWLFTWVGLIVVLLGVHVFGQGITIGYHRLLTHRSFKCPLWVERFFAVLGMCSLEGPPARWVATHRFHHNHSDEQEDPHSPLVAFFWGHIGWLLVRNPTTQNASMYQKYARDLLRDPWYMRLEKGMGWLTIYLLHAVLFFGVSAGVAALLGLPAAECLRIGLSVLVWGVFLRTVLVWHITWSVNSLTHLFGYRNYATGENSQNNWLVGLLAAGEGWHNNHHHDPASASVQHRWWELDLSYWEIRLMERLGLAWGVIRPKHLRHAERDARRAAKSAA